MAKKFNPVNEFGTSEYEHYMKTGSKLGLTDVDTLFPELEGA